MKCAKVVFSYLPFLSPAINGWAKMYKKCAERDGKIDCGEKVGMAVNKMSSGIMTIVDFVMLIWGSVVVFGAWSTWTDDYDRFQTEEGLNYCMNTPMMTAFVLLLLKWVSYDDRCRRVQSAHLMTMMMMTIL